MLRKRTVKPRGVPHVGPILSQWLIQERNGQLLRSLRFWSLARAQCGAGRKRVEVKIRNFAQKSRNPHAVYPGD
jgi:hypothetical protein